MRQPATILVVDDERAVRMMLEAALRALPALGFSGVNLTIPHKIEGYQLDRNVNRCLFCHSRTRIEETRAIPLSVTHYMDRDGTMRGDVSPRRYFCTQCHVTQTDARPLVDNKFVDVYELVEREQMRRDPPAPEAKKKKE